MGADFADRVALTERELRAAAIERGMAMTGDGRVSEADAAVLIGFDGRWFAQRRQEGAGPVAYRLGVCGSRYSYRLSDLATWVEEARENFDATAVNRC